MQEFSKICRPSAICCALLGELAAPDDAAKAAYAPPIEPSAAVRTAAAAILRRSGVRRRAGLRPVDDDPPEDGAGSAPVAGTAGSNPSSPSKSSVTPRLLVSS